MSFALRDYQVRIIEEVRGLLKAGARSVLIQSPTGSGKTALTAHMLGTASGRGHRCFFTVHRRELIKQSVRTFNTVGIPHGVVAAGWLADRRPLVQIAGIQTLARRYDRIPTPKLVVWDEAHHLAAKSWTAVHDAYPDAVHIGLSATPERLDGQGLGTFFEHMVCGPTVAELIEAGWLAPYRLYAPAGVDLSGVHSRAGDYAKDELRAVMDRPAITGDAVEHYRRLAPFKRAVAFCVSIEHSQHVVEQFNAAGFPAAHVDGETDPVVRDATIQRFERGDIRILSNVDLFSEGFDLPALECSILLRPTQSLALYLQQCGRALRPCDGKTEALILDHAGNSARHGLPDDERQWSLEGRAQRRKKADDESVPVRVCPRCFAAQPPAVGNCRYCGALFVAKPREVEQVDGELVEVDPAVARRERLKEQARATTLEDLVELGRRKKYRHPEKWAAYVWTARQARVRGAV